MCVANIHLLILCVRTSEDQASGLAHPGIFI